LLVDDDGDVSRVVDDLEAKVTLTRVVVDEKRAWTVGAWRLERRLMVVDEVVIVPQELEEVGTTARRIRLAEHVVATSHRP